MNLASICEYIELKKFCTLGIGGPARYFLKVHSVQQMQNVITFCNEQRLRYMILGKGSNCLFDDRGFEGLVILNKISFFEQPSPGIFHIGAGYSFALLGVQSARLGWGGLEFASGIPASVGGAVFMNAGANQSETFDFLISVDFVNEKGELEILTSHQLEFAYRYSSFQKRMGGIVGATFSLKPNSEARKRQIEIINYRKKTQPYKEKSAGCVFANPPCGHSGALIEQCGLKGLTIGGAEVSPVHANFFINARNANCKDMLELIDLVRVRVREFSGTDLISEIRHIPYKLEPI